MSHLLDTNVCIALINGTSSNIRARLMQETRAGATLVTSSIVIHELWYGVSKSQQVQRNAQALAAFLGRNIAVVDFSAQDAQAAGEIRAELERKGKKIGEYDTLIAGQAYRRNLILVTANSREFRRIKGLIVEDWTT